MGHCIRVGLERQSVMGFKGEEEEEGSLRLSLED